MAEMHRSGSEPQPAIIVRTYRPDRERQLQALRLLLGESRSQLDWHGKERVSTTGIVEDSVVAKTENS